MNCNEFNDRLADLFDKEVSSQTLAEMKQHMAICAECRALYESLNGKAEDLQPLHSPLQANIIPMNKAQQPTIGQRSSRKWWNVAASVAIFAVGLVAGSTHFFSQPAQASSSFSFAEAIQSVRNVGSYEIQMQVRTTAVENFAYFDPEADFMSVTMQKQTLDDKEFWRVEKEGGRTIVCDGKDQYMWIPDGAHYLGTPQSNFMENYRLFLDPTCLLSMQQMALQLGKDVTANTKTTDSTLIVTTSFEVDGTEMSAIFNNTSSAKTVTIENTCSLPDGLLRGVRVWIVWNGKVVELIRSTAVNYNVAIDHDSLVSVPQQVEWTDLRQGIAPAKSEERLELLSTESPTAAAQRILYALISGETDNAAEALFYYKAYLPTMVQKFAGAKVAHFVVRKDKSYAGVYVFYTLTHANGNTEKCHVALRNDNEQHIWILDGGI